jgi:hypothetical protein
MRVRVRFRWFDFWAGVFVDTRKRRLHVCPVPTVLVTFDMKPKGDVFRDELTALCNARVTDLRHGQWEAVAPAAFTRVMQEIARGDMAEAKYICDLLTLLALKHRHAKGLNAWPDCGKVAALDEQTDKVTAFVLVQMALVAHARGFSLRDKRVKRFWDRHTALLKMFGTTAMEHWAYGGVLQRQWTLHEWGPLGTRPLGTRPLP